MNHYLNARDLAGEICYQPTFFQTKSRVKYLNQKYLNSAYLRDRLEDLPRQFINPQSRPWQNIDWNSISQSQIINLELEVFLAIIKGSLDTEAPIRDYTQTSRQYLETIHPQMARFVGGKVRQDNAIIELGLWEKEERQHTPALSKIYQQLTGEKVVIGWRKPKSYNPSDNPHRDLYRHGLHRIITEYSAVCLYLWLMTRTTGTIQQILAELLQDEINHLTKFWGFGMWLYSDKFRQQIKARSTGNSYHSMMRLVTTFHRMMKTLAWDYWKINYKIELIYTFAKVLENMKFWSSTLTPEYLERLFGSNSTEIINIK
ncbi:MAG: ferritin-like domain-containing protein [Xenococcaceae cyanobacterium MO_188.B19]|nr:ferritin-like domain-containing protein [Xenococcaceae cyanobacterium MO_188.B19]